MSERSKSLDALRGIALLLVFVNHISLPAVRCSWINPGLEFLSRGGWIGVDLFFVLSGFLIANLLFSEYNCHGQIDFPRFFIRRGFKIYPSYYLMIGITLFVLVLFKIPVHFKALTSFLLFLQNYLWIANPFDVYKVWGPTWSLAVEEQFYILLPILLMGLRAFSKRGANPFGKIPAIFSFMAVLCLSLRFIKSITTPYSHEAFLCPFHLRADSLFFGVLMAYYYTYRAEDFKRVCGFVSPAVMGSLGAFFLLPSFIFARDTVRFIYTAGFSLVYLGSGLILAAAITTHYKANRPGDTLSSLGRYSYPIYLWHMPFAELSTYLNGFHHSRILYLITYFIAPMVLGVALSQWVEIPLLRLRDQRFPSRSGVLAK